MMNKTDKIFLKGTVQFEVDFFFFIYGLTFPLRSFLPPSHYLLLLPLQVMYGSTLFTSLVIPLAQNNTATRHCICFPSGPPHWCIFSWASSF